jgi:hypothetical protein
MISFTTEIAIGACALIVSNFVYAMAWATCLYCSFSAIVNVDTLAHRFRANFYHFLLVTWLYAVTVVVIDVFTSWLLVVYTSTKDAIGIHAIIHVGAIAELCPPAITQALNFVVIVAIQEAISGIARFALEQHSIPECKA